MVDTRTDTRTTGRLTGSAQTGEGASITGTSHSKHHRGPGPEVMGASDFKGENVINRNGDRLGDIRDIMLDVRSGRIAYAVLEAGGFLGIGEKLFAIPWRALTLDTDKKAFILDADQERLKNAPGFDRRSWPSMADPAWASEVHGYYGTRPYWEWDLE